MGPVQVHPHNSDTGVDAWEEQVRPLYAATIAALRPGPGTRLLHVGCGTGIALLPAAATGAEVAGLDESPERLTVARDRLPDADLRAADIAELPYDRGCFDQVMAFGAIQFAEAPVAAVAEMARVTRPGGVVAIGLWHNWSGREASAFLSAVRGRVSPRVPGPPPVRDLCRLREVMTEAGLNVYESAEVPHRQEFPCLEAAWAAMTCSPHVARAIDVMGADAAHEIFIACFAHLRRPDGSIRKDDLFQYALGRATS